MSIKGRRTRPAVRRIRHRRIPVRRLAARRILPLSRCRIPARLEVRPPHPPGGPAFAHPGGPPPGGPAFAHPGGPPPGGPQFSYHGHPFNRVHINPFIYPQGWAYRQWAIGAFLPPLFLAPDYYYPDWAALGLAPPPPGYQWVRYGPDLLLVELDNGQVVDVAYGVFYE